MTEVRKDLYIGIGFLMAALVLVSFALAVQAQAEEGDDDNSASVNASQGFKLRGDGSVDDDQPGLGAQVQAQAQVQVGVNQDDDSDDVDDANSNQGQGNANGQSNAVERRSAVANFVQNLLRVADRQQGGIGQQVRVIANEQNASEERTVEAMVQVQSRSKIRTFLFGADYKNLGALRSEVSQTMNRLQQLTNLLGNLVDEVDKAEVQAQINVLIQTQAQIDSFVAANESKISLFGWLAKMFSD